MMSDQLWIAILGTVPSLATLVGIIYGIRVSQRAVGVSQGNRAVVDRVETKMATIESHTNGLLAAAKQETVNAKSVAVATAEGIVTGAQQERGRTDPSKP